MCCIIGFNSSGKNISFESQRFYKFVRVILWFSIVLISLLLNNELIKYPNLIEKNKKKITLQQNKMKVEKNVGVTNK